MEEYKNEKSENNFRLLGNKVENSERKSIALHVNGEAQKISGDYKNATYKMGGKIGLKYSIMRNLNIDLSFSNVQIENEGIVKRNYFGPDLNLEYVMVPQFKLTPFAYAGFGALFSDYKPFYKANLGGGLDYLLMKSTSIRVYSQYDFGFKDKLDGLISGKQNDNIIHFGVGLNFYFGKPQ